MLDWTGDDTHLLLNPRMPAEDRGVLQRLFEDAPALPAHVWLATSGTSGALKLTALAKPALLASAAAVNVHLDSTRADVWCCVLPTFHVGGLGIHARAFLSGARVVEANWDASTFMQICKNERITLTSLVPAQVNDLVRERFVAPPALRAIVVGGGAMAPELYEAARALGWPVLPSYGMTETCSQVATAHDDSPELVLLGHVDASSDSDGRLAFRGPSLLTGYATLDRGFFDPKIDGWFVSEDLGEVEESLLHVRGRAGEMVKIGGESVDLQRLDRIVFAIAGNAAAIFAAPDARLGYVIHLAIEGDDAGDVAAAFNERVMPFERIRAVHRVDLIPRTALGKLRRNELAERLR